MTPKAKLFLKTYEETWRISEAAKRSGMSRDAHYKRLERDFNSASPFKRIDILA
jgi:transcriptional regulator of acetoin/glycerol metabolism